MIGIKAKPLLVAAKGKGVQNMLRRIAIISKRYGITADSMEHALTHFAWVLAQFDCSASFPIVAAAFKRNSGVIQKLERQGIEFAIHGYYHIDHSQLGLASQVADFEKAHGLLTQQGLQVYGFRCPYLRANRDTFEAIKQAGFLYDSSSSLAWDVLNGQKSAAYEHVLGFYGAKSAEKFPALPRLEQNGLVEIPYTLPDDEALIDRLQFENEDAMCQPWVSILEETHRLGELFTLGLHPERIFLCEKPLKSTLQKARQLSPQVWIARLDEIARWWQARAHVQFDISSSGDGNFVLRPAPLDGLTVFGRAVEFSSPNCTWDGVYQQALGTEIQFRSAIRPFIGVSSSSDPALADFLRQQGYIVETAEDGDSHSFFLQYPQFTRESERKVLDEIEKSDQPLVRFGRWPGSAKSALCVTGDIDALTIWDYGLRFLGR
jgi:peptidoglycan/xylan/chitin deacetylase (PgdA/CDA1 family)